MLLMDLQQRLNERRAWLGASDIAAIMGVSPYANAADVYWRKVAEVEGRDTKATVRGRFMERGVLDWFEAEVEEQLERDVKVACDAHPLFVSQLDGRRPNGEPVEAKTAASDERWGAEWSDDIPDEYVVQAQTQVLCANKNVCHVPALVAGYKSLEFRRYVVERNESFVEAIVEAGEEFWRCVEHRTPPPNVTPSLETVKRIRRLPTTTIDLDGSAVVALADLEQIKARLKLAEQERDAAQARVIAMLGDAEAGRLPGGQLLTYLSQNSAPSVNTKLLAARWPEVAEAVVTRGTHRVLRLKKAA